MAWPPTTHQDVQDEVAISRTFHANYLKTGQYTTGIFAQSGGSGLSLGANLVTVRPFLLWAPRTFDSIGVHVSTASAAASGGVLALAIYNAAATGGPGTLLVETATASTETTGPKTFAISQTLSPGVWWVAVRVAVAAASVPSLAAGMTPAMGGAAPPTATTYVGSLQQTIASNATFPATFTGTSEITNAPLIALRAA